VCTIGCESGTIKTNILSVCVSVRAMRNKKKNGSSHLLNLHAFVFAGSHLFGTFPPQASDSYKFVTMILKCTGGGILVPLFLNLIPYPLQYDSYAIAVLLAFAVHNYYPVMREVYHMSTILKVPCIVLYECLRAYVVVSCTAAGAVHIPASDFSVPVFGPVICGTIGGCGYKFLPLSQGLTPLEQGLKQPMLSALLGSAFFYAWILFSKVSRAHDKGHVLVAIFFIAYNLSTTFKTKKAKKD
jgi:hypothetical protein